MIMQLLLSFNFFKVDEFDQQTNIINNGVVSEIEKKFKLKCIGMGGSAFQKNLSFYSYSFVDRSGKKEIPEARELLMNCAEIYLAHVNTNESIRKYMVKYPFGLEDCSISIYFKDENSNTILHPHLSVSGIHYAKFSYCTNDDPNTWYKSDTVESIEEAVRNNNEYKLNKR
jgi:hypothetical protein